MSHAQDNAVLIVEDDVDISNILAGIVSSLGYKPYHCFNGRQALDFLIEKKIEPILVICDINMPEMGGLEFIKFQHTKNLNLNICMLTSDDSRESILQALRLGVTDYLYKPIKMAEMSDKIATLIDIGKNKLKINSLHRKDPEISQMNRNENMLRVINSSKKVDI